MLKWLFAARHLTAANGMEVIKKSSYNLAIIRQKYRPDGGAEQFVSRSIDSLKNHNVTPTLITRSWQNRSEFPVIQCNPPKTGRISREKGFAREVTRIIEKSDFDLVQSHERIACCDIFRAGDGVHREWLTQRKRKMGTLSRWWLDHSPYHKYVLDAEAALFNSPRLRKVICISKMVRDDILRYFPQTKDKLEIISLGIDTDHFNPTVAAYRHAIRDQFNIPKSAFLFIFVGSGFERKGLITAIDALQNIPAHCHLLVVGRDKTQKRYQKTAQSLGVGDRIHFAGVTDDVRPFYGAADAFILPTLYEPFSNAVIEAMACALPVITSTRCGGAELIHKGVNGLACDALDQAGFTQAMMEISQVEDFESWKTAARAVAEQHPMEQKIVQMVQLYESLLSSQE